VRAFFLLIQAFFTSRGCTRVKTKSIAGAFELEYSSQLLERKRSVEQPQAFQSLEDERIGDARGFLPAG
jgi:hypothetical protein